MNAKWWKAAGIRALKTVCQTAVATIGTSAILSEVNWIAVASASALAGILSVIMSTADSYLLVSVQTCVHDIGQTICPEMREKTELRLSRLFAVILPIGALVIALYIKNAYAALMFAWCFYAAAAGIPAFAALFWKKATKQGIIASMVSGFTVCIAWKLLGQPFGLGAAVPGTIACAVALVTVSLATYPEHPAPFLSAGE